MAVTTPASSADTEKNRRDGMRSARLKTADPNAPTTKPICTVIVSHACPPSSNAQTSVKAGITAEAENQVAIASSSARASSSKTRHLRCAWCCFSSVMLLVSLIAPAILLPYEGVPLCHSALAAQLKYSEYALINPANYDQQVI